MILQKNNNNKASSLSIFTTLVMKLKKQLFLSSLSISAAVSTAAAATEKDGPAGNNQDCAFGSNYRYIQNYSAGEACSFAISNGQQRINVTLDSNTTGTDNSTVEIYSYHYNNAMWKTGEKESSTYCMPDMKWIMNKTIYADGSMLITTIGDEWIQLGPDGSPVDNVSRPGLYQLKPGAQQLYYNSTEVALGTGGTIVYVKGNIIDLCAAVENSSASNEDVEKPATSSGSRKSGNQQVVALVILPALMALFSLMHSC